MTVDEYAAVIRGWARFDQEVRRYWGLPAVDPNAVRSFSRVAAVWERLRWDIHTKGASPGDRNRLDELTERLQELATGLGLGRVDPEGFLPGDPSCLIANKNPWYEHCMYRRSDAAS